MGEVLQFRRRPVTQVVRGFSIKIDPAKAEELANFWGSRQREKWRVTPAHDGTVIVELGSENGVLRLVLSVEDAETLSRDVREAAVGAEKRRIHLRGEDRWRAEALSGCDAFMVRWQDLTAVFVGLKVRVATRCWRCRNMFPAATQMYRQEGQSRLRWRGGAREVPAGALTGCSMRDAVCRSCMSPEVPCG